MSDTQTTFKLEELEQTHAIEETSAIEETHAIEENSAYLLTAIEVYNWGPFHGRHHCEIDSRGTAIIGPTGSGKTTLVDALMTLLAPFPKYNLASTGGHESDRDLISYVRGVSGVENAQEENSHVARPSKTTTGLSAVYSNGISTVTLGVVLWVEGASNAADDLKKTWFFARNIPDLLDTLLTLHHEGGKAALTRHARDLAGLRLFSSKKEYLARARAFFEVSENAFTLLNRAAGLKQINSIDQIFRELVLDDHSAFNRAAEVAGEFDTLHGIYEELQTARKQRDSLLPVRQGKVDWEKAKVELMRITHIKDLLPVWFAHTAVGFWEVEEAKLGGVKEDISAELAAAQSQVDQGEARVRTLNEEYLLNGGAAIQDINELLQVLNQQSIDLRKNASVYQTSARRVGLSGDTDKASFLEDQQRLPEIKVDVEKAYEQARRVSVNLAAEIKELLESQQRLLIEIRAAEARPNSNIPAAFQTFREALADELQIQCDDLPFVAEMVEIKLDERRWQGAIERAIGPERLRILVPSNLMRSALSWINRRDNQLHVRLQSADASLPEPQFFHDGFTRKLAYRDHPLRAQVMQLLFRRDRHCVDSTDALQRMEHAMTIEGTMSDREGRFEKQDQKALNSGWMTGFDNQHLLSSLREDFREVKDEIFEIERKNDIHQRDETLLLQKLQLIGTLETLEFINIDFASVELKIQQQKQRIAELTQPDSDVASAKARYEEAVAELKEIRREISDLTETYGACKAKHEAAKTALADAIEVLGDGLQEEDLPLLNQSFPLSDITSAHQLFTRQREAEKSLEELLTKASNQVHQQETQLVRRMSQAKNSDTGALSEAGTELCDLEVYLTRLETLEQEALPDKLHRFLDYLNESSGQGVTQLLSSIGNEVSFILERVADLNATLSRVDFRQGHFLQLQAQAVGHEMLQRMETAQKKLRVVVLNQRKDEGEAHYRALGDVVRLLREASEKRHTLGAQALLDPRHRLQFSVVEVERATGRSSGSRKGSQTGSGGEKEMMASYILTASLSYALCPAKASQPRYASIVLDEAFSKSSPAAAARIIEALRAFGLHPLFVTPNKEIALLKSHTRSAILVHNKNQRATLTTLSWEQIESHARVRAATGNVDSNIP